MKKKKRNSKTRKVKKNEWEGFKEKNEKSKCLRKIKRKQKKRVS